MNRAGWPINRTFRLCFAASLVCAGAVLAGCSSNPSNSTTTSTAASSTTTTSAGGSTGATSTTTTTTTVATTTTLATPPTSGTLSVTTRTSVPGSSAEQEVLAEAPDGAVFGAEFNPSGAAPDEVWVVDGSNPAAEAETVTTGVSGLTADATYLYVAGYKTVVEYDRASGAEVRSWQLPPVSVPNSSDQHLVSLVAAGGKVWVLVTLPTGNEVEVYEIDPGSSSAPLGYARSYGDAAIGPDGTVYYEDLEHQIVRTELSGSTIDGPALASTPNAVGGGVESILTVAAGDLWTDAPASQGIDVSYRSYDATSLDPVIGGSGAGGSDEEETLTDTLAGPLVAVTPQSASCYCVERYSLQATLSDPTTIGSLIVGLVGPYPAVVVTSGSGLMLERLG
jgi:hypothetical protein